LARVLLHLAAAVVLASSAIPPVSRIALHLVTHKFDERRDHNHGGLVSVNSRLCRGIFLAALEPGLGRLDLERALLLKLLQKSQEVGVLFNCALALVNHFFAGDLLVGGILGEHLELLAELVDKLVAVELGVHGLQCVLSPEVHVRRACRHLLARRHQPEPVHARGRRGRQSLNDLAQLLLGEAGREMAQPQLELGPRRTPPLTSTAAPPCFLQHVRRGHFRTPSATQTSTASSCSSFVQGSFLLFFFQAKKLT